MAVRLRSRRHWIVVDPENILHRKLLFHRFSQMNIALGERCDYPIGECGIQIESVSRENAGRERCFASS